MCAAQQPCGLIGTAPHHVRQRASMPPCLPASHVGHSCTLHDSLCTNLSSAEHHWPSAGVPATHSTCGWLQRGTRLITPASPHTQAQAPLGCCCCPLRTGRGAAVISGACVASHAYTHNTSALEQQRCREHTLTQQGTWKEQSRRLPRSLPLWPCCCMGHDGRVGVGRGLTSALKQKKGGRVTNQGRGLPATTGQPAWLLWAPAQNCCQVRGRERAGSKHQHA